MQTNQKIITSGGQDCKVYTCKACKLILKESDD